MKNQHQDQPSQTAPLSEFDWDFDNVLNAELVACCVWEYARESVFIRDVRQRCIKNWRAGGLRDERLSVDLGKLHSIGPVVEVLARGFYFAPGDPHRIDMQRDAAVTNSFPAPWQDLAANERDFRVRALLSAGWYPASPFERTDRHDAKEITEQAEAQWRKVFSEYDRVRREYPDASEVELTAQGKLQPFTGIPVSILREDGKEVTAVAINWARFTNDEITGHFRKWLKANRPREIRGPNKQGRKLISDRVKLERLAIMRLLHRCRVAELRTECPGAWKRYDNPNRRWRKDVEKAYAHFREFFPFLRNNDFPRSWPPKDWPGQMK
jgi:hypothetical protein